MDYRRSFGLRAPCPIGDSTIMVPQVENYSLFATPYLTLSKKINKLIEGARQEIESKSEEQPQRMSTRSHRQQKEKESDQKQKKIDQKQKKSDQKQKESDQKLPEETSQEGDGFGIVLNVATVEPKQLAISFEKDNGIKIEVQQDKVESKFGSITFSRKCTYKYQLPEEIDKKSLEALWTLDDYLIILPADNLRQDVLEKSRKVQGKPLTPWEEPEDKKSKKSTKQKKLPDQKDDSPDVELNKRCKIPVHLVTRMLRPRLDIFMLRKYMVDFESYVSTSRKFFENASFVTQNSKTAEIFLRYAAKSSADKYFEAEYVGGKKTRKKHGSGDSGYSAQSSGAISEAE